MNPADPTPSVTSNLVSQTEYLPYAVSQFTTAALSITGPDALSAANVNLATATIQWSPATDNAYPIAHYDLQYRLAGSQNWFNLGQTRDTSVLVGQLTRATTYDIEVAAIDVAGNVGNWTIGTNLFTTASAPAPTLMSPAKGSGQPPITKFAWERVSGAAGGYNIIIDTNPADLPTLPTGTAGSTAVFSGHIDQTRFTLTTALQLNTTYYWEVQGLGRAGAPGAWSAIRSFTTIAPAISVAGIGQTIQSGQATVSTGDGTDFGTIIQGSVLLPQTFTIQNTGTAVLTLKHLTVPQGFTVVQAPRSSLAPGHSTTFKVRLKPGAVGTFSGMVSFVDNVSAPGEDPFTFAVSGSVMAKPAAGFIRLGKGHVLK